MSRCTEHPLSSTYVGQSFSEGGLYKRHAGHKLDCKAGKGGLGEHYDQHHGGNVDTMEITIIDCAPPGNHALLDHKEEFWMYQLKSLEEMGYDGLNKRDDLRRQDRESCNCKYCKRRTVRTGS